MKEIKKGPLLFPPPSLTHLDTLLSRPCPPFFQALRSPTYPSSVSYVGAYPDLEDTFSHRSGSCNEKFPRASVKGSFWHLSLSNMSKKDNPTPFKYSSHYARFF